MDPVGAVWETEQEERPRVHTGDRGRQTPKDKGVGVGSELRTHNRVF